MQYDNLTALIERLRPYSELPEVPRNSPYYYASESVLLETGITYEFLETLPADVIRGIGTANNTSVILFDKDALEAWAAEHYPRPQVNWPEILGTHREIGRG